MPASDAKLEKPKALAAHEPDEHHRHGNPERSSPGLQSHESPSEALEILHFNDVYEVEPRQREPVGGVARFITKLRQFPKACVLFSGDCLAPSLMSTVTKGVHIVRFINMMNIKAACMGNHDFDFGVDHLVTGCIKKTNFPWMLSNAYDSETGKRLAGGEETVILEHEGWRIGLMGLIEEEWLLTLSTIERDDVFYVDYVKAGRELEKKLREQGCDVVIALTHMRNPNDERLAREVPEIDLILGGHDHEVYSAVINGVPIIKSGTDFRNLTRIMLTPDAHSASGRRVKVSWEELVVESDVAEDEEAARIVDEYRSELNKSMEKVLGDLGCAMDARFAHIRTRETNCANWIADCVKDGMYALGYEADVVLLNSGTLRADDVFPPGPFLMRDLVTLLPMLDELCVLEMTGRQVYEALENGVSQYPKMEGRFPCVSGVTFEFDPNLPPLERIDFDCIRICGKPVTADGLYKVITKAYMATGKDGYSVFTKAKMISDSEGTPLLADLVRTQFSHLAEMNRTLMMSPPPGGEGFKLESDFSLDGSGKKSTDKKNMSMEGEVGRTMSSGFKKLGTMSALLNRSIHIGREFEVSPQTRLAVPRGAAEEEKGMENPNIRNQSISSTNDLEQLLKNLDTEREEDDWPFTAPTKSPQHTHCHPHKLGGRFQIFGKVDGRIKCRHPFKKVSSKEQLKSS